MNARGFVELGARFWSRVVINNAGCWVRTNAKLNGYSWDRKPQSKTATTAHRISYEYLVGPIPQSMDIDHLCRNRACVNPAHLEPVTRRENARRGIKGVLTTHCPQGHPYDSANTFINKQGRRICRVCRQMRNERR